MSPYPSRFSTHERDWLLARLQQSDIQTLRAAGGDSYLKTIADLVRPDFEGKWTAPYMGETDSEYEDRRSNAHKNRKRNFPRHLEESHEAWNTRRGKLGHNIHRFVIEQFCTKAKRKQAPTPSIPVPDLEPPRKSRRISALDVFQGDIGKGKEVASSSGGKYAIGNVRTEAAKSWHTLPTDQREPYETRARVRNQERAALDAEQSAGAHDDDLQSETPLPAQAIAGWLKLVLEKLGAMNWGGFICAGGPDANGDIWTYIDFVGHNRHGDHLLGAVTKAAGFASDELESLVTLWVEQSRTTESEDTANGHKTLPYQVLRALQMQKEQLHIPAPEILAAVLSEAFKAHNVALRVTDRPDLQAGTGPASSSAAHASHSRGASSSRAGIDRPTHTGASTGVPEPPALLVSPIRHVPATNSSRPHIPDPLVDGPFGYPGPFTIDTSGIDFQLWGGEFALANNNSLEGTWPDSFLIPTSNVRTEVDGASAAQLDSALSVLSTVELAHGQDAATRVSADGRELRTQQFMATSKTKTKKGPKKACQALPSGVLMPDAHGAETRARPHRERQMTEKGQNYAAERNKARRK